MIFHAVYSVAFLGCDSLRTSALDGTDKISYVEEGQRIYACIVRVFLFVTVSALLLLVWAALKPLTLCNNGKESLHGVHIIEEPITDGQATGNIEKFNCIRCPQAAPVVANKVEGVQHPFFISLADLGSPEKPNRNFLRMLKGKPFRKPDISHTIQEVLAKLETSGFESRKELLLMLVQMWEWQHLQLQRWVTR